MQTPTKAEWTTPVIIEIDAGSGDIALNPGAMVDGGAGDYASSS